MADKASALPARGEIGRWHERGAVKAWMGRAVRLLRTSFAARAHWLVPLVLGLLLGRATVLDTMKPFGTAYVIALAAAGLRPPALVATVGAMVGSVTSASLTTGVEPWPVLIVVWSVTVVAGRYLRLAPSVIVLGAVLGAASLRVVAAAFAGEAFLLAGAATAVELLALLVFFPFVGVWTARPAELGRGQIVAVLIVTGLLVLGMEGMYVYEYSLSEWLMRGILLLAALIGGVGVGAAAGATMGLVSVLGAGGLTWSAALLSPAGLLAGLGAQFGRPGAFAGLIIAHLLMSPYASDGDQIASALTHSLLAGGFIALVPRTRWRALAQRVPDTAEARRARRERRHRTETAARRQLYRIAHLLEDVGSSLVRTRHAPARRADGGFDRFVIDVSERVCAGCTHHGVCWDTYVYQTYRDLLSTATAVSASGRARPADLPAGLQQRCIQPERLTTGISRLLTPLRADVRSEPANEVRDDDHVSHVYHVAQRQFAGVAAILGAVADEVERIGVLDGSSRDGGIAPSPSRYRLIVDVAQAAGDGSAVSGDCFRRVDLGDHRVALIVSDGMGSGARAAAESEAAVAMLERFLLEGFELSFAVQTINSVLLLRSSDDEMFATLDVCVFDLERGTIQMLKTGAAPTFIRRRDHVDIVPADSLPVGILQGVEAATLEYRLDAGDLVVMVTDGALELGAATGDKAAAVGRALRRLEKPDAHAAVDGLFKRARSGANATMPDDVTVVAAQLVAR